jgi:hypothetical protein
MPYTPSPVPTSSDPPGRVRYHPEVTRVEAAVMGVTGDAGAGGSTLHPYALQPKPEILHPESVTLKREPYTANPRP